MNSAKGNIFAIKRFALHDGQGIRTTIFFKGCPLRCSWCHNPEGINPKTEIAFIKNNCISCKRCLKVAQNDQVIKYDGQPFFNLKSRSDFKPIIKTCPANAVVSIGENVSLSQVMDMISKDRIFYQGKGGVTFSGGEPLMQIEFLKSVLRHCRETNINTAIETSLYAPLNKILPILKLLDTIYVDFKMFDGVNHLRHTGVDNKVIKDNISAILKGHHKEKVVIRTPLIPGITANLENIEAIAKFIFECFPDVQYELLNYNYLASGKYENLASDFLLSPDLKPLNRIELEELYEVIERAGIKNVVKAY